MFGIVAAHEHQLPLAIHVVGIDDAQPLLPPSCSGQPEAVAEQQPHEHQDQHREDEEGRDSGAQRHEPVVGHE